MVLPCDERWRLIDDPEGDFCEVPSSCVVGPYRVSRPFLQIGCSALDFSGPLVHLEAIREGGADMPGGWTATTP